MRIGRRLWVAAAAGALACMALGTAGCGGAQASAKLANVKPGDMPSGAEWTGVYFSELYGYLHVVQEGSTVTGKWMRPVKDRWGELHGEAVGDLLRFQWKEHTIGVVGPNATKSGKGYFKYKRPDGDNVDDQIAGEIGRGADEVGEAWDAIKQRNVPPDIASIGGTGASDVGGGDWDSESREKGSPEPPAPPP